jgi:hypothetical protein
MKFVVAQLGARTHYAVPRMLYEVGMLAHLYTDICAVKGWPRVLSMAPRRIMPASLQRLVGRVPAGIPADKLTAFTRFGWKYARRRNRVKAGSFSTGIHVWAGQTLCDKIIRQGLGGATGVYTFNSAGLELLQYAKQQNLRAVMEQTIAPTDIQQRLRELEARRFPGWEPQQSASSATKIFSLRVQTEWAFADLILCGSQFVKDSVGECGGPVEKCVVVPYGVDTNFTIATRPKHKRPLRVLTVGAVGLRKGSPYVLETAKLMKGIATFRMVGPVGLLPAREQELRQHVCLVGSIPRAEMLKQYAWADVFLLPSICEGSATATYEALMSGLPVICTPNTGSVIRDGVEGFVVPICDSAAICEQLERLASDRDLLGEMAEAAVNRAKGYCTLEAYSRRLVAALSLRLPNVAAEP